MASRFDALHTAGLTALVGREEEFELLLRCWSRTKTGQGQVVLMSGEAGIGKSRLTAALLERVAGEPHTRLRYFCSPQHTDGALYPIIGQMERAAGLAYGDKPQAKLDKLNTVLAQTSTSPEDTALPCRDAGRLPNGRTLSRAGTDAGKQRRQATRWKRWMSQLVGLAHQRPVLMIVEDAHWVDPDEPGSVRPERSIESGVLPVLLIVTFRPEFNAQWVGQSQVTRAGLTLNRRLGEARSRRHIVTRIFAMANKELPADMLAEIVERTDGIPLFIEEDDQGRCWKRRARVRRDARLRRFHLRPCRSPQACARADGAPRPARPCQGGGADRVGDSAGSSPTPCWLRWR